MIGMTIGRDDGGGTKIEISIMAPLTEEERQQLVVALMKTVWDTLKNTEGWHKMMSGKSAPDKETVSLSEISD